MTISNFPRLCLFDLAAATLLISAQLQMLKRPDIKSLTCPGQCDHEAERLTSMPPSPKVSVPDPVVGRGLLALPCREPA